MLKEAETEETIVFFYDIFIIGSISIGEGPPPPSGYAYATQDCEGFQHPSATASAWCCGSFSPCWGIKWLGKSSQGVDKKLPLFFLPFLLPSAEAKSACPIIQNLHYPQF